MNDPRLLAVATALPPHRIAQSVAKERARDLFADLPDADRLLAVFDRCGVDERYLAFPPETYLAPRPFGARNDDYIRTAVALGEEALSRALLRAEVSPESLDILVFTTTTGLATPSVDALLAQKMGLAPGIQRLPLFGLGCAAGAAGLALAADLLRARPGGVAAVLSVELCSLTLLQEEATKVNLVGTALFGDGAACAVLGGGATGRRGPRVVASESVLFPGTQDFMGWRFSEMGLGLVLSPQVPAFLSEALPPRIAAFLGRQGLRLKDVRHFALHPGGRQVLAAYRRGLGLSAEALAPSAEALRRHGNLSSAAVFFSLDELWQRGAPAPGEHVFLAAVGPGFGGEFVLLEW